MMESVFSHTIPRIRPRANVYVTQTMLKPLNECASAKMTELTISEGVKEACFLIPLKIRPRQMISSMMGAQITGPRIVGIREAPTNAAEDSEYVESSDSGRSDMMLRTRGAAPNPIRAPASAFLEDVFSIPVISPNLFFLMSDTINMMRSIAIVAATMNQAEFFVLNSIANCVNSS